MAQAEELVLNVKSDIGDVVKQTEQLDKATKKGKQGFKGIGTAVKGVGMALKAAGIGIIVALFAKLMEVFSSNQKVLDTFNTAMTAISMAFNDFFNFLGDNIDTVSGYFSELFEKPQESMKEFGDSFQKNIEERVNSYIDTLGILSKAVKQLFAGDFAEAWETTKDAGKEYLDVLTGVDGSFEKMGETVNKVTDAIVDYTTNTWNSAAAVTEMNKAAEKAGVEFERLNAKYLKAAEVQRQIRDDETKTFAERIAANKELDKILEKQQKAQKEQIQIQIDAAQAQYNINQSDENWIALEQEKVALLQLEETITGQLSEQKTNAVALEKELLESQKEIRAEGMSGLERELQELQDAYDLKVKMAEKAGMKTTAIEKQFNKQKSLLIQENVNAQLEAFSGLAGALSELAGDNKALAIASAVIDTYVGANKAFAQGGTAGFITGAAVIAAGLNNVKTIMQTDVPSSGGGGGVSAPAQPPAPQMMSGAFELSGGVEPEPTRAYVVTDEMTNSQNQLANIRRRATI
jgi:hypothetical protein